MAAPFTVGVDEPDGIAPHAVTFTLDDRGGATVGTKGAMDINSAVNDTR